MSRGFAAFVGLLVVGHGSPASADDAPVAAGTIEVTAPAKLAVTLVGYTDAAVMVVTRPADRAGVVRFAGLDRTGATAYFALGVVVPKVGRADRLMSFPAQLTATEGARITLVEPTTLVPKTDGLDKFHRQTKAIAAGKVRVAIEGPQDPTMTVSIVDAATGKPVAHGDVAGTATELELAVVGKPDAVFYAQTTSKLGTTYRSAPVQLVTDRGSTISILIRPRTMMSFALQGEVEDQRLDVQGRFSITNYAWSPSTAALEIPLPRGFEDVLIAHDDEDRVAVSAAGIKLLRPLPPGPLSFRVKFALRAGTDSKVTWRQDNPIGVWKGGLMIAHDPGLVIEPPPGAKVEQQAMPTGDVLVLSDLTILPNALITMTITLPRLTRAEAAFQKACAPLGSARNAMRGKPMRDFTAPQLDGKPLKLASLRGKPILVSFSATWDGPSKTERPTFAKLAATGQVIVAVMSDANKDAVIQAVGLRPAYRVVLDAPVGDKVIGPITGTWGVERVPESFLVDKKGLVRGHFIGHRDWGSPDALACVKTLVSE